MRVCNANAEARKAELEKKSRKVKGADKGKGIAKGERGGSES